MRFAGYFLPSILIGCTAMQPIGEIVDAPALAGSAKKLSRAELARAIEHDAASYSIRCRESVNLDAL